MDRTSLCSITKSTLPKLLSRQNTILKEFHNNVFFLFHFYFEWQRDCSKLKAQLRHIWSLSWSFIRKAPTCLVLSKFTSVAGLLLQGLSTSLVSFLYRIALNSDQSLYCAYIKYTVSTNIQLWRSAVLPTFQNKNSITAFSLWFLHVFRKKSILKKYYT